MASFSRTIISLSLWEALLAVAVSLLYTLFILHGRSPLRRIPGPNFAAYTRWWLWRTLASGRAEEIFTEIHAKYGSVARIGPNHIIISDPDTIRRVLSAGSEYTRGPWFDTLKTDPRQANLVSERDAEKHLRVRKIFNQSMLEYGSERMEAVIDDHVVSWLQKICHNQLPRQRHGCQFDLARSLSFLAVDITTDICLGETFGCVQSDQDQHRFLAMVRRNMAIQQFMSVFLEFCDIRRHLAKTCARSVIVPSANDGTDIGEVLGIIKNSVLKLHDSSDSSDKGRSLVAHCIAKGLAPSQADKQALVLLAAGSDTTSTAAQGILLGIISNPRVYRTLQKEIDIAVASGQVGFPIKEQQTRHVPYLEACIREGLRLYQPLFQLRERMVPPQGDVVQGYGVPGGTYIGLNAMSMQRNTLYGHDPDIFRPERWLVDDADHKKRMLQTLDLVFGSGPTKCLGGQIAFMELNKIVFELLRNFDVSVVNPLKPWKRTSFGIFYQEDFYVHVIRRGTSAPPSN